MDGLEGQHVGRQRELDFAPAGHDLIGAVLAGFGGHADIGHAPAQGFAHAFGNDGPQAAGTAAEDREVAGIRRRCGLPGARSERHHPC